MYRNTLRTAETENGFAVTRCNQSNRAKGVAMTLQDISLPVDVPWTLIATSKDMLANHDKRFPHAMWKSSMAVFSYDPPLADMPEEFPADRELTFLKVVCSITSYVPGCGTCPQQPERSNEDYGDYSTVYQAWRQKCNAIEETEHRAYACAGALVQVAVYPAKQMDETDDPAKLAYFASFEPKKREMIEVATESGETMTQSKSDLNVRKGTTATNSIEDSDILTGVNVGGGFAGAQASVGVTGKWGTIKKSGSENVSVRNSDSSRELREQSSHTTSLSQLYHLLNSYHLGTNRAIFFVQPRPHTVQQKEQFTFIDGPQNIEGIQEFFLILSRPIGTPLDDYCVDALLYTAHLDDESTSKAINDPKTAETQWLDFAAVAPRLPDGSHSVWNIAADAGDVTQYFGRQVGSLAKLWGDNSGPPPKDAPQAPPAQCDGYITPTFLTDPNRAQLLGFGDLATEQFIEYVNPTGNSAWKIDRTRGLGGYDLWEDPNNRSGVPTGTVASKFPPEALIDVISLNNPDDLEHYLLDYGLRVRAQAWPSTEDIMMYHGRIKAYFIRNDAITQQRSINMFVTVRGTSTCGDSPFFNLAPDDATLIVPDIAAENHINPANVSPWTRRDAGEVANPFSALPNPDDKDKQLLITQPKGNSTPSGLDHTVIGASRAKMANVIGNQVQKAMNTSLSCLTQETDGTLSKSYSFRESDFFFDRVARKVINREMQQLTAPGKDKSEVLDYLLNHERFPEMQRHFSILQTLRQIHAAPKASSTRSATPKGKVNDEQAAIQAAAAKGTETTTKPRQLSRDSTMPTLTLADPQLGSKRVTALHKAQITSALDLIGVSSRELARTLGTSEASARTTRLRVLGLYTEQKRKLKPGPPEPEPADQPDNE